jgi:hypothetical protein
MGPMAWTLVGGVLSFPVFLIRIHADLGSYERDIPFAGMLWVVTLLFIGLEFWESGKPGDRIFTRFYSGYTSPVQKFLYVLSNFTSVTIFVLWFPR